MGSNPTPSASQSKLPGAIGSKNDAGAVVRPVLRVVGAFIQRIAAHISQACAERFDVCQVDRGVSGFSREDEAFAVGRNIGVPNTEAGPFGESFGSFGQLAGVRADAPSPKVADVARVIEFSSDGADLNPASRCAAENA